MAGKIVLNKISIYIPQEQLKLRPVERLIKLSKKRDRSVNYLVVEAIMQATGETETCRTTDQARQVAQSIAIANCP